MRPGRRRTGSPRAGPARSTPRSAAGARGPPSRRSPSPPLVKPPERPGRVLAQQRGRIPRPVREAPRRVEGAGLVERSGRAGVDAETARAAVEIERRRRLELDVRDERPEDDPGAVAPRDQECVLAVEADAGARCGLA